MANHRSAEKAARQSRRGHLRNKAVESAVKSRVRKAEAVIATELGEADAPLSQAIRALDRAAKKGVLHPNNAARRKGRLMQKYNAAKAAASAN